MEPPARPTSTLQIDVVDGDGPNAVTTTIAVDEELAFVFARARRLGDLRREGSPLSFSSLLAAFLTPGAGPVCEWFADYVQHADVQLSYLFQTKLHLPDDQTARAVGFPPSDWPETYGTPAKRTDSARLAMEEAEAIRRAAGGGGALGARHLMAGFIGLRHYHDDDFDRLKLSRRPWCQAFVGLVRERYPEEAEFWGAFEKRVFADDPPLVVEAGVLRARVDADAYTGTDLLDIGRDVNALAALIASHQTQLPLAIGLFGDWGSGKTFFMRHLQARVRRLSAAAEGSDRPQREVAYWKRIAQIEFNAWHYGDGKLWPSLVQHIFENLRCGDSDDEAMLRRRRDEILRQLGDTQLEQTRVEEVLTTLKQQLEQQNQQVAELQEKHSNQQAEMARRLTLREGVEAAVAGLKLDPGVLQQASEALEAVGATAVGDKARDLQTALRSAGDELSGFGGLLLDLIHGKQRLKKIVLLALVLVAPIAVSALASLWVLKVKGEWLAHITERVAAVATFLGAAAMWIHKKVNWLKEVRGKLEAARATVEKDLKRQQDQQVNQQAAEIASDMQKLQDLQTRQAQAVAKQRALEENLRQAREELLRTSSSYRLNSFIEERADSKDYRKYLGIVALVRRDFEKLAALIAGSNKTQLESPDLTELREDSINRVVLYIDDLDRCDEKTVVEVLKAVHLLLALPLFVVVVAVDPRWLARCLEKLYPELLASERVHSDDPDQARATALDYLEKIFQIPISLPRINEQQRVHVVQCLLKLTDPPITLDRRRPSEPGVSFAPNNGHPGSPASDGPAAPGPTAPGAEWAARFASRADPSPRLRTDDTTVDLAPAGLSVSEPEWAFVGELASLLSATPRVLKRFANTYRLVKAGLPPERQAGFVDPADTAPFRLCMFQLAVLIGLPAIAAEFRAVLPGAGDRSLGQMVSSRRSLHPGWQRLHLWLEHHGWAAQERASTFAAWLPYCLRYTFSFAGDTPARDEAPAGPGSTPERAPPIVVDQLPPPLRPSGHSQ